VARVFALLDALEASYHREVAVRVGADLKAFPGADCLFFRRQSSSRPVHLSLSNLQFSKEAVKLKAALLATSDQADRLDQQIPTDTS
jgi:hypothetical protein